MRVGSEGDNWERFLFLVWTERTFVERQSRSSHCQQQENPREEAT